MRYTEIKNTGLFIPSIIFGTSALGNLYNSIDSKTKQDIVKESVHSVNGPVVFDTAGKYGAGLALEELGIALSVLDVEAEKVIISNKLGWLRTELMSDEPAFERGVWKDLKFDAIQDISAEGIIRCWEQGNALLGKKYMPRMLSVHDPDEYLARAGTDKIREKKLFNDIVDAYNALFEIRRKDKSVAIGVGAKNWKVIRKISEHINLDWVMFANSLTIYSHPSELVNFMSELQKNQIFIINSAVFNAGFLIGGRYFDYRLPDLNNPEDRKIFAWRESFLKTCDQHSVSPSHACIRFSMSHPAVSSIALNTSNPFHVKRNVEEVENEVPLDFFRILKEKKLIGNDYPFV